MKKTLAFFLGLAIAAPMFASEVAEPEAAPAAQPKVQEILAKMPVKVSGYLQTGWNWSDAGAGTSSFQAKRLRLMIDGKVASNIAFRLQVEAFNGVQTGKQTSGQKDLQVMDAFATWTIKPSFKLRAGQFYTPMGFENYDISPATLETVDFSNICYRMACRNAIGYDYVDYGRDLGIMVLGDVLPSEEGFNYLSYNVVLSNGSLPCKDDNNKSKDLIGAITVRPIKHLMIKGAYNWGEYSNANGKYLPMNRFIAGAWYNNPTGLDVRAEYGMIKSDEGNVDEKGAYVLAGWHAGKWLPVVRWDMYKDEKNPTSTNNYNRILAGVSYEVCKNFKLQANYNHTMYEDKVGADDANQIQIMGLFKF
ncbi:MAG: porin [Bacteroidales bacterium]|nr:porin [Bacteroidales bacterium]